MRGFLKSPASLPTLFTLIAVMVFAVGCDSKSGPSGDKQGTDTRPEVSALQTPLGLTGTRGTGPDVPVISSMSTCDEIELL